MKTAGDLASFFTVVATLAAWLPAVAALLSIVWSLLRIYESETVRALFRGRK